MSSEHHSTQTQEAPTETEQKANERSQAESSSVICTVCQQPLEKDRMQRLRGEPVHIDCAAELRCGISLRR